MLIRSAFLILILTFILPFQALRAQEISMNNIQKVKVGQLSDEQIIQVWNKLKESGVPEEEAYQLMQKRGMDPIEVDLFKKRVTMLGLNKKKTAAGTAQKEDISFERDTLNPVTKPAAVPPTTPTVKPVVLSLYGTEFFNQSNIKFEPDFSVATPKGYVLGPGDELIILVTGLNESSVRSKISPEGNLQIPYAGIVNLNGFTIEQATSVIRNKMAVVYPALRSGRSQLAVNLGNTRSIRITLVGEVKTPGSYTLSSLSTLFNALYLSGGPSANGSLRNIELIRNNKVYRTVDFYSFLQKGLLSGNIRLEDQDVIRIPVYRKRVSIDGEVKRAAIYELKAEETLTNLVEYAGGYTDVAYRGIAKVEQVNEIERQVKDVPASMFGDFVPGNGDKVSIGSIQNRFSNRVILEGAVNRPGVYELSAGFSLSALLKEARGIKDDAYTQRGYIKRTLPNLDKELISFKPLDIIEGRNDIPLLREDSVMILDRASFIDQRQVTVNGNVRKPGTFTFREGMKLADVIAMAGGFQEQAADHRVEISRIIRNDTDSVANQLVETFTVNLDNKTPASAEVELQALDYIYVPRLVNYRPIGNINVMGEVLFPGEYAVQKRDETVLEFIQRAGGLSPYASLADAQVFRNNTRVNLDLTNVPTDPLKRKSMILLPGDSIYIPKEIQFVQVTGAVNNPQYVNYEKRRFKYYINAAGGAQENARLKGAYVQYPNGLNKPVRNFLFFRNYPSVKPGSRIIVPEKSKDFRLKLGFAEITAITSAITALVGLIAILNL
ncbi:capsule biosynthesis protein [Flavihumibacter sp. R14]|nr:capsule biosynthesis protein [Flavihumibacter soli]